jgi:hypothetical protein
MYSQAQQGEPIAVDEAALDPTRSAASATTATTAAAATDNSGNDTEVHVGEGNSNAEGHDAQLPESRATSLPNDFAQTTNAQDSSNLESGQHQQQQQEQQQQQQEGEQTDHQAAAAAAEGSMLRSMPPSLRLLLLSLTTTKEDIEAYSCRTLDGTSKLARTKPVLIGSKKSTAAAPASAAPAASETATSNGE